MLRPDIAGMNLTDLLERFRDQGYARLGRVLTEDGADRLTACAMSVMGADAPHPDLFFQHDSPTGRYADLRFDAGWVGPSDRYRKLERLERIPVFAAWIENALFERIAHALLGGDVRLYRTVLWNKAPRCGMAVPWHQDDGRFWGLDRPPMLQIWTALDDASVEAGCLEVVPESHRGGLATPEGGTIPASCLYDADAETNGVTLPVGRGEGILVHNHLWHRTGRNHTDHPRRAISVSFLEGGTRCTRRRRAPRQFEAMFTRR